MKTRKTKAFYIEAIIITFFLLAFSTVILQIFTAAWEISDKSRQGTDAVQIAQNATGQFCTLISRGNAPQQAAEKMNCVNAENGYEVTYSADGLISQNGEYKTIIRTFSQKTNSGKLHTIDVSVYPVNRQEEKLFDLITEHFVHE